MPTGTRPKPGPLDVAIAAMIRSAMARQTPPIQQAEVAKATGIDRSTLSRLLKPEKTMTVAQLDAICRSLGLSTGALIDAASRVVAEREADRLREQAGGLEGMTVSLRGARVPALKPPPEPLRSTWESLSEPEVARRATEA